MTEHKHEHNLLRPPLQTWTARGLLLLFAAVHIALAVTPGPTPTLATTTALAFAITSATMVVLLPEARWQLLLPIVAAVLAAGAAVIVVPGLPQAGWPGYSAWPLGAATLIAVGLALRSKTDLAWLVMLVLTGLSVGWSLRVSGHVDDGLALIARQIGTLTIGSMFAVSIQRAARRNAALQRSRRQAALARQRAEVEVEARTAAAVRVRTAAGPLLTRLARPGPLTTEEQSAALALEGRLRDEIALAPLLNDDLVAALDSARRRGVDIAVLGDPHLNDASVSSRYRAASWIAAHLRRTADGSFVARAVYRDGGLRVTANSNGALDAVVVPASPDAN